MVKKKGKSKMSLSVKKSSKQKKGQQKQSQSLSVTVNLGKKGGRQSKPQNPKLPPNYPPFYNQYNQPSNWFNPPPQKPYSVFPEGETALNLGLSPYIPVNVHVEGNPLKKPVKEPTLKVAPVDENILPPPPAEDNPFTSQSNEPMPQFSTSLDEPVEVDVPVVSEVLTEEEIKEIEKQQRAEYIKLRRKDIQPEEEITPENALKFILEQQATPKQKISKGKSEQQKAEEERQREEELSRLAEEKQQKAKEKGALQTFKKLRQMGFKGGPPVVEQLPPKRGRPLGSKNKIEEPTFDPSQTALTFPQPVVIAEAIPAELTEQGATSLLLPLAQQPSAERQQKIQNITFAAAEPAEEPAKEKDPIQRQRKGEVKKERKVIQRATPEASVRIVN